MVWELTPWRPFRELTTLRDEMDRIWERFFKLGMEPFRGEWVPSLDVSGTKNNIVVKAEVPGMDAKDIDISLTGDFLTIKGEKRGERRELPPGGKELRGLHPVRSPSAGGQEESGKDQG